MFAIFLLSSIYPTYTHIYFCKTYKSTVFFFFRRKFLNGKVCWLVVELTPNFLLCNLGLQGMWPPRGSFWGIIARIYANFGENHGKIRTARSSSVAGDWTWHLSSASFERKTTQPLVEPWTKRKQIKQIKSKNVLENKKKKCINFWKSKLKNICNQFYKFLK